MRGRRADHQLRRGPRGAGVRRGLGARRRGLDGGAGRGRQGRTLPRELAVLRGQTYWFARAGAQGDDRGVEALVEIYRPAADALKALAPQVLSPFEQKAAVRRAAAWTKAGAPKDLAHQVALYQPLTVAGPIADLAREADWPVAAAARIYHHVGEAFAFDRLREAAGARPAADAYNLAVRRLIEDMLDEQAAVARAVIAYAGPPQAGEDARNRPRRRRLVERAEGRGGARRQVHHRRHRTRRRRLELRQADDRQRGAAGADVEHRNAPSPRGAGGSARPDLSGVGQLKARRGASSAPSGAGPGFAVAHPHPSARLAAIGRPLP